ncbi:hypothetical protein CCYA_CCYA11G3093 [Cyanidiococcus yangmingshanensis]|nr:hypothetical protein CCYA_CCYA11G3093 [Cyanidiococcus yangmingshanensis]
MEPSTSRSEVVALPTTGRAARDRDALFGADVGSFSSSPSSASGLPPKVDKRHRRGSRSLTQKDSGGTADAPPARSSGSATSAPTDAPRRTTSARNGIYEPREAAPLYDRGARKERAVAPPTAEQFGSALETPLSREDEVAQLRRQATDAALRGRQSSRRALQLAREARAIGVDVTMKLGEQDEQLDRVQNDMDEIHGHLTHSDEIIHDMQSFWKKLWPWARDRNRRKERYEPSLDADSVAAAATQKEIETLQRQREDGTLNRRDCAATRDVSEPDRAVSGGAASPATVPAHALLRDAVETDEKPSGDRRRGVFSALSRVTRRVRGLDDAEDRRVCERTALLSSGAASTSAADASLGAESDAMSTAQATEQPWDEHVRAQDRDLDDLSVVVSDLRTLAVGIGEQVRQQSVKIDVITKDVDYGRERIHENNRRIRRML